MNPKKRASTCTVKVPSSWRLPTHSKRLRGVVLAASLLLMSGSSLSQEKPAGAPPEPTVDPRLLQVKRICIQKLGEDALGTQVQEMVIAKLFESKRFSMTENCDRADFVVKGSITERSERTFRSESEGIGFGERLSHSESQSSRVGSVGGSTSSSAAVAVTGSQHESLSSSEVKQQAAVTLRVVDKQGDILWAISLESTGGKTKGAIGDAAERAVRRLLRDIERAERQVQKQEKTNQP